MSDHVTIKEIAAALDVTQRTIERRAVNESWPHQEEPVRGGRRRLYPIVSLPKAVRDRFSALQAREAAKAEAAQRQALLAKLYPHLSDKLPGAAPVVESTPHAPLHKPEKPVKTVNVAVHRGQKRVAKTALDDQGRRYQDAAVLLCATMDAYHTEMGVSLKQAAAWMAWQIGTGLAEPHLIAAERATQVKSRAHDSEEQRLKAMTGRLYRMLPFYREGRTEGDPGKYLVAGKREKEAPDPIHTRALLLHFCRPARPTVMMAWKEAAAWYAEQGLTSPAVDTFYRIEKQLPVTIKYRGRMTGGQWKALLPYVARDVSMFHANDIWVGDGHSFKAKVQHPIHGQPFVPEVTVLIDWVSRRVVGWSVDMAESTIAVSAAFRRAQIQTRARPLVYYSDNGSGQTGKAIDCPIHGTLARQGIDHQTGIPGNAQGRGIIERLWQVTTIPLARTYPTCTWKGADKEATRTMLAALNKKDGSMERLLPSFELFMADCERVLGWDGEYNTHHQHRELGGLTPAQAYDAKLDPDSVFYAQAQAAEIGSLWLPEVSRQPQRGVITLFGNEYARGDLPGLLAEGEKMRVRFDINDARQVWLYRMDGQYLGTADWDAHKRAAFPVPFMQQKREERVENKVKSLEKKADVARAELGEVIDGEAIRAPLNTVIDIPKREKEPTLVPLREALAAEIAAQQADAVQPAAPAEDDPFAHMRTGRFEDFSMGMYLMRKAQREAEGKTDPQEEVAAR